MTKKILFSIILSFFIGFSIALFSIYTNQGTQTANQTIPVHKTNYDNLSSKPYGWGLKKEKNTEPDINTNIRETLSKYNAFYIDPKRTKSLYLTFDEGYENGYTEKILDILSKTGTPAAFFVTGPYLKKETILVQRMIDEGHIVGNHTVNHPNLAKCSLSKAEQEITELENLYEDLYGKKMTYLRPPEGEYSEQLLALANDMGYKTIFWSFAYKDWDINNQKGAEHAYNSTIPYLHNGAIILLHAVSADNADALESIINTAKELGYTFKSLDEL